MPATCLICEHTIAAENGGLFPRSEWTITRKYHGDKLDGTWCSPRDYTLSYPAPPAGYHFGEPLPGYVRGQLFSTGFYGAFRRVGGACPDCGVLEGKYHHLNCPSELCPRHETPLMSCGCAIMRLSVQATAYRGNNLNNITGFVGDPGFYDLPYRYYRPSGVYPPSGEWPW